MTTGLVVLSSSAAPKASVEAQERHIAGIVEPIPREAWYQEFLTSLLAVLAKPIPAPAGACKYGWLSGVSWGAHYPPRRSASLVSLGLHAILVALLCTTVFTVRKFPALQVPIGVSTRMMVLLAPNYPPQKLRSASSRSGRGGGGAQAPLAASKGPLPKFALRQFTPPRVQPFVSAVLPLPPALVAAPVPIVFPDLALGDPLSNFIFPSNGSGERAGIGTGSSAGIGASSGPGYGNGDSNGASTARMVYRPGGDVSRPRLVQSTKPEYTSSALARRAEGTVVLYLEIDTQGRASNIRVHRSLSAELDWKAIECVRQWLWEPGKRRGVPVIVSGTVDIIFELK